MSIVKLSEFEKNENHEINVVQLRSDEEKLERLVAIVTDRYHYEPSMDFLGRIMDVIHDNAFCRQFLTWYDLRVVKEINHYISTFNYEDLKEWSEYAKNLPTPFLKKEDADSYLFDLKVQEIKTMMLDSAMKIHSIFYSITTNEIDGLIPYKLLEQLSIDKVAQLAPLIDNIMKNQALSTLKENGYKSWEQWDAILNNKSCIGEPNLTAVS